MNSEPYSLEELFTLWKNFRGQHDEVRVMADFAGCTKAGAEKLIAEFNKSGRGP